MPISKETGGPPAVLVVDDDAFMRVLLQRVLADAGFGVRTYASAADLLATADLVSPAVLLLDMAMPAMSGTELHAALRQRGVALPVIFLSGTADLPAAVAAMRNGAVDFLEKPFTTATLIECVRRAQGVAGSARTRHRHGPERAEHERRLVTLTVREREIAERIVQGYTSKQIAHELGGSFRTVEVHRARVMEKMGAATVADLVRMVLRGDLED